METIQYYRNLIMETIDYGDLIMETLYRDPILCIYVYRLYRETLHKDIYIYKSFGKTKLIAKKTNLIAKRTNLIAKRTNFIEKPYI